MSLKLIDRSPDIKKLRNEGYEVEIIGNYLLIHSVPYVNSKKEIAKGTLVSNVSIANNQVTRPDTHVIHFIGDMPCNIEGIVIRQISHVNQVRKLNDRITINHSFSNKPRDGYKNYYEKMTQYIKIISAPAISIDSSITAKTFKVIESSEEESVLHYSDTNSSRAEIDVINQKISNLKIGIIGLGGTGSYILDFVAKTLVGEIHLFDGDTFIQHNAFRAPGAPSIEELNESILKVDYYDRLYSKVHKYVIPHGFYLNETNVGILKDLDFVFVCIDRSEIKKLIFKKLEDEGVSFIDTGLNVERVDDSLIGMVRTTISTPLKRDHIYRHVSLADIDEDNDYTSNIQIAEINALNAIHAVIKWKKFYEFYNDQEKEHNSTYSINVNQLVSNECPT